MYHEQFEELKHSGKLPTPSGVGLRILLLTRSEDCSLDEIVAALQADPALTGRVLKLANSAANGGAQPATSVREAAVRLGLRTVCNVALGFSLISGNRSGRCAGFDYDGYWSWSLACAVAAQHLGRVVRLVSPPEAFTCALLARIGRLALASVHPVEYATVLQRLRADRALELAELESEAFCIQHREAAASILEDWGLPPFFSEVVLHHDSGEIPEALEWPESRSLLRLLQVAGRMADVCTASAERRAGLWPTAREAAGQLGLDAQGFQRLYDQVGFEWQEWGELLKVPAEFGERADSIDARSRPETVLTTEEQAVSLRILAVDDEPISLRLLTSVLEREGHRVSSARNGREALAIALEQAPQMVITDWLMPEMDGLELCKRLRSTEAGRDLYILVLTAYTDEERVVEALEAGADDYVFKPFTKKLLLARINPGMRVIQLQEKLLGEVRAKQEANFRLEIEKRRFLRASMTDALTELPNRRYAMKRLEKEWANSLRTSLPLSLILLDIDDFKKVNDGFGHDVGDDVLRSTARAINRVLRRSDTCARLGGEEFLVICAGTPLEGARLLAERIRTAVETNVVSSHGFQRSVTASLGVSSRTAGSTSIDALLKAADEAVYVAKREGRNRVAVAPDLFGRQSA
jgi:diguanylate cyclase (GGDEF)-like protein